MNKNSISKRYAQAILNIASEKNEIEKIEQDFSLFEDVLKTDEDFSAFFTSKLIPSQDKINVIEKVFGQVLSSDVINLFNIIFEKNREEYITEIISEYKEIANEYRGIAILDCYSAVEVSNEEKEKLTQKLSEALNKKIKISINIDENLLGGLKIKHKDQVIDGSIINKLDQYKKVLMK